MDFHVYLLRCGDGSYYIGHSDDLDRRIAEHRSGQVPGYTQSRLPVELVWSQDVPDREQAFAAERQIKGWSRAKKEALIAGDFDLLRSLARRVLRDEASAGSASPQDERVGKLTSGPGGVAPPPAIILVRPQLAENIGKAARAMLNFGLTDLRLVSPRDGWPNPGAGPAASGADSVIAGAKLFDSVAAATADCAHVFATTVRKRGVTKPVVTPEAAAAAIHAAPERSAILFGPERSGLETDDVALARTILTVPINPEFGSLNLAQAVILVAYEWSKAEGLVQPSITDLGGPAPQEELEGMLVQLDTMLVEAGYFFPPDRAPVTRRMLRTMLTKPAWTAQEVRTMRGVLSALDRPRPRRGGSA